MLLPCSSVAPTLQATAAVFRVVPKRGKKKDGGERIRIASNGNIARSSRAPFEKSVAAITEKDLSLPLPCTSSPRRFAPMEEPRYRLIYRKQEERGKGKSARIPLLKGKRREGKKTSLRSCPLLKNGERRAAQTRFHSKSYVARASQRWLGSGVRLETSRCARAVPFSGVQKSMSCGNAISIANPLNPGGFRFFPFLCAPPSLEEAPTHLRTSCSAKQNDAGEKRYRCCDVACHGRAWVRRKEGRWRRKK